MIDPISSVKTNQVSSGKKINVDWKNCTPDEIKSFSEQGMDVPSEILRWAEELALLSNIPDDVTYESLNGSTDIDEINNLLSLDTESGESLEVEKSEAVTAMSPAEQERKALDDGGVSLNTQAQTFMDKSSVASGQTYEAIKKMDSSAELSNNIVGLAEALVQETTTKLQATKSEYDSLTAKAQNSNDTQSITPMEFAKLSQLENILNTEGAKAQAMLAGYDGQLSVISSDAQQNLAIASTALDYGKQTVDIGLELMGKSAEDRANILQSASAEAGNTRKISRIFDIETGGAVDSVRKNSRINVFKFIFDANYRLGYKAANEGAKSMDTGAQGEKKIGEVESVNDSNKTKINSNKSVITSLTNVPAQNQTNNNADNSENPENKEDITLADNTVITDVNEIIRRKERKGIA